MVCTSAETQRLERLIAMRLSRYWAKGDIEGTSARSAKERLCMDGDMARLVYTLQACGKT